jgi:hypothetical protein
MIYPAVGNKCAISFGEMGLPIESKAALSILLSLPELNLLYSGFVPEHINLIRGIMSSARYKRHASQKDAPNFFDCSSLMKWFYGLFGVLLPRRSLQQFEQAGFSVSPFSPYRYGDLIFSKSRSGHSYYRSRDPNYDIGHVAMVSESGKLIQMTKEGITESDMSELFNSNFRGVRRVVRDPEDFYVFEFDPALEINSSDDFCFLLLDRLKT